MSICPFIYSSNIYLTNIYQRVIIGPTLLNCYIDCARNSVANKTEKTRCLQTVDGEDRRN